MDHIDTYKYPGEDVLINKFDCHDQEVLYRLEADSTAGNLLYLQLHPVHGKFDFNHLKRIHRFIFQDVYEWAGKIRTVDIGKNNLFCRAQFIEDYAAIVFRDFYSSCSETKEDYEKFVKVLTDHYADMNALHPFREGNGRAQREFTRELCLKCGYVFDLTETTHEEMLDASITSFSNGDNTKLMQIFRRCIVPINEYSDDLQGIMQEQLLILSRDDMG